MRKAILLDASLALSELHTFVYDYEISRLRNLAIFDDITGDEYMTAPSDIKSVRISGLHDHQEISVGFESGLNIVHGKNGTGKTTLLHVLANLAELDFERFRFLQFREASIKTERGDTLVLERSEANELTAISLSINGAHIQTFHPETPTSEDVLEKVGEVLSGRPVYLPAFRPILEAASMRGTAFNEPEDERAEFDQIVSREQRRLRSDSDRSPHFRTRASTEAIAFKTVLSRRWFGRFVPIVRYPSLTDVERELFSELESALIRLSRTDQQTFATVFGKVLTSVLTPSSHSNEASVQDLIVQLRTSLDTLKRRGGTDELYADIETELNSLSDTTTTDPAVSSVLKIYVYAINRRAEQEQDAFRTLNVLQNSVNHFLGKTKSLVLDVRLTGPRRRNADWIELPNKATAPLSVLSSGERHVLTLLFAATHMTKLDGLLLIDEPELSLHVDWQRIILGEIQKQAGSRQIIACTHSPEVAADHPNALRKIVTNSWSDDQPSLFERQSLDSSNLEEQL